MLAADVGVTHGFGLFDGKIYGLVGLFGKSVEFIHSVQSFQNVLHGETGRHKAAFLQGAVFARPAQHGNDIFKVKCQRLC